MKTLSLFKAVLSEDMNIFNYSFKNKKNFHKLNKIIFPLMLFLLVCISVGTYANLFAFELSKVNLTYVMLTMFIIMVTLLTFIEGIYKSQGILFDSKDNDLLFSLPIKKSQIILFRIIKLLLFQYLYNLMFFLPSLVVYVYYEKVSVSFYFVSILMTFLVPIIPTIFSSLIGYFVKMVSSKTKSKKIVQTLITSSVFLGIFYFSMNLQNFVVDIAKNATSINDMITKIYYPAGLYINLINKFNILDLVKLLLINIIPFVLFIVICQKYYFKIISKFKEYTTVSKKINKEKAIKQHKPIVSLIKRELNRYFSSTVLMFNSGIGLLIILIISILLCFKGEDVFNKILAMYEIKSNLSLPVLYYFLVLFVGMITSITSSMISLEGKTINITKSLPIKEEMILNSKILSCYIIELPFIILSSIIFIIKFKPSFIYILLLIILTFVTVLFSASMGLQINLKYPKMNYKNDTEVVKQSVSSMASIFVGIFIFFASVYFILKFIDIININLLLTIHLLILTTITIFSYIILLKKGPIEYRNINV